MDDPPHPHGGDRVNTWRCTVPGCTGCGCGYPSQRAANDAQRRHDDAFRAYHRLLLASAGTEVAA